MKAYKFLFFALLIIATGCGKGEVSYDDFKRSVDEINEKQRDIFEKSGEVSTMMREVQKRYPDQKITFDTSLGLSKEQEDQLVSLISQEKDVTFKGLLEKIVSDKKEISNLQEEIKKVQEQLPKPYAVKRGDSHRKVAMSYLTDIEGLDKKTAQELVDQVALVDEMVPGFNIWLYYNKDSKVFGTFVTQGSAKVNPNKIRYSIRKEKLQEAFEKGVEAGKESLSTGNTVPNQNAPETPDKPANQ